MDPSNLFAPYALEGLGAAAGLVAGLASSAHCALMCGPLACAAGAPPRPQPDSLVTIGRSASPRWNSPLRKEALAYHLGRFGAYAAVGAGLGMAGEGARHALTGLAPVLPWVMAGALVATAFGVGKRLPVPALLKRLATPLIRKSAKLAPVARAGAIGAATPLLPCATLYGLFVAAVAAASALGGATLMAAFALGATPSLALMQAHAPIIDRHPRVANLLRRVVPLLAAAVLVWRAVHAGTAMAPPSCH